MRMHQMNDNKIMVGTHSVKALDSRNKQSALRVGLKNIGDDIFGSHLLNTRYYAVPRNAADIKTARLEAVQANADAVSLEEYGTFIPKIQDGKIKQVLLPYLNDYLSLTPTPSMHIMDMLNQYSLSFGSYMKHCVQPIPASIANHGDPVCAQGGYLKLVRNWVPKSIPSQAAEFPHDVIIIKARCENMNISSSYVSMGLPQLTAIGGFVHSLERQVGASLPFAFGIKPFHHNVTAIKRGTVQIKKSTDPSKPVIISDEITVNAEIVLALNINDPLIYEKLQAYSKKINRFAGGALFDLTVELSNHVEGYYWYEKDNDPTPNAQVKLPDDMDYKANISDAQVLQKYLEWESEYPAFSGFLKSLNFNFRLIQSGYALLNQPVPDDLARSESKLHAWGEPVFSLIRLGSQPDFFELDTSDGLYIWK